jgi:outer membrane cobalamin receptor
VDVRWHHIGQRYPNSAGTNPRDPFSLLDAGLERRLGTGLVLRGEVRDVTDQRAEFLAGYPTPGRTIAFTLTMVVP